MTAPRNSAEALRRRLVLPPRRPAWPVRVLILLDVALGRLRPPRDAGGPRAWGCQLAPVRVPRRGGLPRQGGGL